MTEVQKTKNSHPDGGELPTGVTEEVTDVGALAVGYVSIKPLQLDLTNYKAMDVLKKWEF